MTVWSIFVHFPALADDIDARVAFSCVRADVAALCVLGVDVVRWIWFVGCRRVGGGVLTVVCCLSVVCGVWCVWCVVCVECCLVWCGR